MTSVTHDSGLSLKIDSAVVLVDERYIERAGKR